MWKWVKHRGPEGKFAKMNETLSNWVKNCENYLNVKKLNETMWNRTKHCTTHGNIMKLHETLWKIVQPKERSRDHFWNQRLSQNWSQSQRWNRRLRIRRIKKNSWKLLSSGRHISSTGTRRESLPNGRLFV